MDDDPVVRGYVGGHEVRRLQRDNEECLLRFLSAIWIRSVHQDKYLLPTSREFWWTLWYGRIVWHWYYFICDTLHVWWVREEMGYWQDGFWVRPAIWRQLNDWRHRTITTGHLRYGRRPRR